MRARRASPKEPAMSSTKRRRARTCDGTAAVALGHHNHLRCAATSKPIRSALLDPAFRRRLALRAAANDDALLLGVSFVFRDPATRVGQLPRKSSRFDAVLLETFEPVAWRGSVVILRRRWQDNFDFEMRACNALTGHTSRLPSPGHVCAKFPHALRTQIFSSEAGEWGAVVEARLPPRFPRYAPKHGSYPLVLGDTIVHWLYGEWHVVALDVSTATATVIELPQHYRSEMCLSGRPFDPAVHLAASADGRLSLLAEAEVISMWTHSAAAAAAGSEARWTRKVVIDGQVISRAGRDCLVRFLGFGERTGTVMLQTDEGGQGLVKINLRSKKALLYLHETDLPTLIKSITNNMKRF
uniref:DUF7595 domain-containing protein n=1 Tax=Setaria italica TaxID=4555 RepID=K4AIW5_SETIT